MVRLGHRNVLWGDTSVIVCLMTAIIESESNLSSDVRKCMFCIDKSIFIVRHRKMSVWHQSVGQWVETWENVWTLGLGTSLSKVIWHITFILVWVYRSASVGRLATGMFFTVLFLWRMQAVVFLIISTKSILRLFYLLLARSILSFSQFSCLPTAEKIAGRKH